MTILLNELVDFHQQVFHYVLGTNLSFNEFSDLTTDESAQMLADKFAKRSSRQNFLNDLQYNAIEFPFAQTQWNHSRFGNGKFPLWYGSIELETGFYESIYHWKKRFFDAPSGFQTSKPTQGQCTFFKVTCKGALIDLRNKTTDHPVLNHPNESNYNFTQELGSRIYKEGHPGLITKSARHKIGENLVIFNKRILSSPSKHGNYIYKFNNSDNDITITNSENKVVVLTA